MSAAEATRAAPAVEGRNLSAGYDGHTALDDVTFTVEQGCLAGLVGPNGSGKSTLLRVILGLHKPWRGEVRIVGREGSGARGRIGYMPQSELVDWSFPVTALDVVIMGRYGRLGLVRRPGPRDRQEAMAALERVRLADLSPRAFRGGAGGAGR